MGVFVSDSVHCVERRDDVMKLVVTCETGSFQNFASNCQVMEVPHVSHEFIDVCT